MTTETTTKKAYLVTFAPCTRVIVAENATEEEIVLAAREKILSEPGEYINWDNMVEHQEDTECPYDPETDKEPAPDPIDWTRKDNDVNGNPRYVCHFLTFITDKDREDPNYIKHSYDIALARAKKLGGRKYHNKQYGGGIIFQSYNTAALEQEIFKLMEQYK